MGSYSNILVGGYQKITGFSTAQIEQMYTITNWVDVGGTNTPTSAVFYVERTPTKQEFLRGACIFNDTGAAGQSTPPVYGSANWDYSQNKGSTVFTNLAIAAGTFDAKIQAELIVAELDSVNDRYVPLPLGTILQKGITYRICWRFPFPDYISLAQLAAMDMDGYIIIEDIENLVAVQDFPMLKKKV